MIVTHLSHDFARFPIKLDHSLIAYLRCVLHVGIPSFELSVQNSVRLFGWSKWKVKIIKWAKIIAVMIIAHLISNPQFNTWNISYITSVKIILVRIPISFGKWEIDSKSYPLICCAIRNMFSSWIVHLILLSHKARSTLKKNHKRLQQFITSSSSR